MKSLALVVPCYNGVTRLPEILKNLQYLRSIISHQDNIKIYFSDNNSSDGTIDLVKQNSLIFDNVLFWEKTLKFDDHLIEISRLLDETHIFFLGVNYLIKPKLFHEIWKTILSYQGEVDLACLVSTDPLLPELVCEFSENRQDYFKKSENHFGGISSNLFARKYFLDKSFASYVVGPQWMTGDSRWPHTVLSMKLANDESSKKFYSSQPLIIQNPLGKYEKKLWHSPPELPIIIRIQYYKIAYDIVELRFHKFLGISIIPGLYDHSIASYASKLPINTKLLPLLIKLFGYCPHRLKPIFLVSITIGLTAGLIHLINRY